ncbi:Hypothetical predicted protein [Cloeon dipterum]|uniref:Uncharacterized protein n=2 Tax=Cloeon dipterum TaxID=197152 RepID=A0A8S1CT64_9INSE|nr:Hypothetical predicted protein [Cloeon dipterum]
MPVMRSIFASTGIWTLGIEFICLHFNNASALTRAFYQSSAAGRAARYFKINQKSETAAGKMPLLSLKEIVVSKIVENIDSCRKYLRKFVAPPMLQKLLEEVLKDGNTDYEQKWQALPHLLSWKTENFETGVLSKLFTKTCSLSRFKLDELLEFLAEHAAKLKRLIIQDPRPQHDFYYWSLDLRHEKYHLEKKDVNSICQMSNLAHLGIEKGVLIRLSGFFEICSECENLLSINCKEILIDVDPEILRTRFGSLKNKFPLQECDARNIRWSKLTLWFSRLLPLQRLIASPRTDHELNFYEIIPDVTHLTLDCTDPFLEPLDRFPRLPSIEHAELMCSTEISAITLHNFLIINGQFLESLILVDLKPIADVTLKYVFERCSNLKSLELRRSDLTEDHELIPSFGPLQRFVWELNDLNNATAAFSRILTAPHLREFSVSAHKFDHSDLKALVPRIERREILTSLETFSIKSLSRDEFVNSNLRQLLQAVKSTSLNCSSSVSALYLGENEVLSIEFVYKSSSTPKEEDFIQSFGG